MPLENLIMLPRAHLWKDPTPLEKQLNLARAADAQSIFVKRDDCNGLAFGGNKVRQLEYYLGAAIDEGADTVLMTGAVQSNFVRAAAAACAKLGLSCHIQLEERVANNTEAYRNSGNVLLNRMLGATLYSYPEGEDEAGADRSLQEIAQRLRDEGKKPYIVPMHPSHPPLGAFGYINAAIELVQQFESLETKPQEVIVPSGSGNTHGGLLYGLRALGCDIPVTGICVRRDADLQGPRIFARTQQIAEILGETSPVAEDDVVVEDQFLAPGYGKAGQDTMDAIKIAAQTEGLILDPVYSGKAMAALVSASRGQPGRNLVFIHTGGGPGVFGYAGMLNEHLGIAV